MSVENVLKMIQENDVKINCLILNSNRINLNPIPSVKVQ